VLECRVHTHHRLDERRPRRYLREVRGDAVEIAGAGPLDALDAAVEARVVRGGAGLAQERDAERGADARIEAAPRRGQRRRAAVLAVVAMDVDRPWQIAQSAGDAPGLLAADPVVADGQVDVAQAVLLCPLNLRPRAVHRQDSADAQLPQRLEAIVALGAAAAVEVGGDAEDNVQTAQPAHFLRGLGRRGQLRLTAPTAAGEQQRQGEPAREPRHAFP
jgi:hypothetical protein